MVPAAFVAKATKEYCVPGVKLVAASLKIPVVVAASLTTVTLAPPICGLELSEVFAYTTPRAVIVAPPFAVTFPPSVAVVPVMLADVGVVTVGRTASAENVETGDV